MAFKKTLVQRLFNLSRFSTPSVSRNPAGKPPAMAPDPGVTGRLKLVVQHRPLYQSATLLPAPAGIRLFPPPGEKLVEKLRGMNIAKDRVRLDGLVPFLAEKDSSTAAREGHTQRELSVGDVRKVLRASQMEMIRAKLREIRTDWISYTEFVTICRESCGGNTEQGLAFAKTLDESGTVIVLGNAVCLRPHQEIKTLVANAIQNIISPTLSNPDDSQRKELEQMEEQKLEIDWKADSLVRRELWVGLGYMVVQTAAFMRLTFWELSWDVMEPICFYVTSVYFMAGYAFFLRTSKEPSFEGFFQSRFSAKQNRLMKAQNFDLDRYNELRKALYPHSSSSSTSSIFELAKIKFDDHHKSD